MALRLAAAGYCGGDPEQVMKAQATWVLAMVQYENMKADYQEVYLELNREK